jgi:hypothetical protein
VAGTASFQRGTHCPKRAELKFKLVKYFLMQLNVPPFLDRAVSVSERSLQAAAFNLHGPKKLRKAKNDITDHCKTKGKNEETFFISEENEEM